MGFFGIYAFWAISGGVVFGYYELFRGSPEVFLGAFECFWAFEGIFWVVSHPRTRITAF
jgi:hypothetical protein